MRHSYSIFAIAILSGCNVNSNDTEAKKDGYEKVYINDGAVQCESAGMSVKETAQIMINKGIDVINSECASLSGVDVSTVCGAGDVNINLHTIHAQSLPDAQELGFASVSELRTGINPGYVVHECPEPPQNDM